VAICAFILAKVALLVRDMKVLVCLLRILASISDLRARSNPTFLSPALNSFHSVVISLAASPSAMPLKSPLFRRSVLNLKYAESGRLICRSSLMGERPLPDRLWALPTDTLSLSVERAALALRICSGVCDLTQSAYAASFSALF
jgi:hypothetical protein